MSGRVTCIICQMSLTSHESKICSDCRHRPYKPGFNTANPETIRKIIDYNLNNPIFKKMNSKAEDNKKKQEAFDAGAGFKFVNEPIFEFFKTSDTSDKFPLGHPIYDMTYQVVGKDTATGEEIRMYDPPDLKKMTPADLIKASMAAIPITTQEAVKILMEQDVDEYPDVYSDKNGNAGC